MRTDEPVIVGTNRCKRPELVLRSKVRLEVGLGLIRHKVAAARTDRDTGGPGAQSYKGTPKGEHAEKAPGRPGARTRNLLDIWRQGKPRLSNAVSYRISLINHLFSSF